jgi:tetratricopeptide (TPR) repeat protein
MDRRVILVAVALIAGATIGVDVQKVADQQAQREALELHRAGLKFLAGEQFDRAVDAFSSAVAKDSLQSGAYYGMGQAYMNLQRFSDAAKAYAGCIEALRALNTLQQTNQFDADKRREEEIRTLRTILSDPRGIRGPTYTQMEQHLRDLETQRRSIGGAFRPPAEVLLALGSAHFKNGDRDAAEGEWKAATEANPKLGEAHNNLAVIYMQTGRLEEAEQSLKLAEKAGFRVNPQFKEDLKKKKSGR